MTTKQPSLIVRLLYKAAQKGWIRLEQNSFLYRLMTLGYLLKFRLFSTLAQYSPSPYRAIWSLLTGQDRYLFYTSSSPQAQEIRLSPANLGALLRLLKAGYPLVSVDSTLNTLSITIASDLIVLLRPYDVGCLNGLLIEKEYGTAFPGYRILDVGAYIGDTPLFFAAHGV
jgi:hypothetical protein